MVSEERYKQLLMAALDEAKVLKTENTKLKNEINGLRRQLTYLKGLLDKR